MVLLSTLVTSAAAKAAAAAALSCPRCLSIVFTAHACRKLAVQAEDGAYLDRFDNKSFAVVSL